MPFERIHVYPISEPEHVADDNCWCEPELDMKTENGNEVWVHKQVQ